MSNSRDVPPEELAGKSLGEMLTAELQTRIKRAKIEDARQPGSVAQTAKVRVRQQKLGSKSIVDVKSEDTPQPAPRSDLSANVKAEASETPPAGSCQ